jgi:hypothetical protein
MTDRIVTVASPTNIVLATIWRDLLAAEGIEAELGGALMATGVYVMMPQLAAIDVLVKAEDAARARALIAEWERGAFDPAPANGTSNA